MTDQHATAAESWDAEKELFNVLWGKQIPGPEGRTMLIDANRAHAIAKLVINAGWTRKDTPNDDRT